MPVYEFYCPDCHTVFSFRSRRVNPHRHPPCPRCQRPNLERQVSRFAFSKGRPDAPDSEQIPAGLDEQKLEQAMLGLAGELKGINEDDPRAMAHLMRRLADSTGLPLNGAFKDALQRLERGDDPEAIEDEFGGLLDHDNADLSQLFNQGGIKGLRRRFTPPDHDDTLYRLPDDDELAPGPHHAA